MDLITPKQFLLLIILTIFYRAFLLPNIVSAHYADHYTNAVYQQDSVTFGMSIKRNNSMVKEDYVSFEIAKLLQVKGFNWECKRMFRALKNFGPKVYDIPEWITNEDLCNLYQNCEFGTIPTLQMAMKWLREVHGIAIGITFRKPNRILWEIYKNEEFISGGDSPLSYEDVCDDAIKYAINLI